MNIRSSTMSQIETKNIIKEGKLWLLQCKYKYLVTYFGLSQKNQYKGTVIMDYLNKKISCYAQGRELLQYFFPSTPWI